MKRLSPAATAATVMSLLSLLSACAVGPERAVPQTPLPQRLTREAAGAGGGQPAADAAARQGWWKAFGSPVIDDLVQRALTRNPTLDAARASWEAARELVTAQRGAAYPALQLEAGTSRQNVGAQQASPLSSNAQVYSFHTAQLSVGYTPDIFGANRRQVEGLEAGAQAQQAQLQAAQLALAGNVVAAALQEAVLRAQLQRLQQAVAEGQQLLQLMRGQLAQGYASGLDVASQQNQLTQLQQTLPPLEKQLEQTRDLLTVLVGATPDQTLPTVDLAALRIPEVAPSLPSEIVQNRPDIRVALANVDAASAAIGVARAARLPQLNLTATYGAGNASLRDLLSPASVAWNGALGLVQPLFSGGTLAARERAAVDQWQAAVAQYQATVLQAFQNVADSLYAHQKDQAALQAALANLDANARSLQLTQRQWEQGYAARGAWLAAQQSLLLSEAAVVAARGAVMADVVALNVALGHTPEGAAAAR